MPMYLLIVLVLFQLSQVVAECSDDVKINSEIEQLKNHLHRQQNQINRLEQERVQQEIDHDTHVQNLQNQIKQNYKDHDTRIQHIEDGVNTTAAQADNIVAFSAYAIDVYFCDTGDAVIFDGVILNAGAQYDPGTSIFTCSPAGYYLFSATVHIDGDTSMVADLVVGSTLVASLGAHSNFDSSSGTMVVECPEGTQVFVRCADDGERTRGDYWTRFTGVLLQLL